MKSKVLVTMFTALLLVLMVSGCIDDGETDGYVEPHDHPTDPPTFTPAPHMYIADLSNVSIAIQNGSLIGNYNLTIEAEDVPRYLDWWWYGMHGDYTLMSLDENDLFMSTLYVPENTNGTIYLRVFYPEDGIRPFRDDFIMVLQDDYTGAEQKVELSLGVEA